MEDENIKSKWYADRILETAIAISECVSNKDYERAILLNENLYEFSSKLEKATETLNK